MDKSKIYSLFTKRKNKQRLLIILIIGIILLIAGGSFLSDSGGKPAGKEREQLDAAAFVTDLEKRLSQTLSKMRGVGKVTVMITLESKNQVDIAQNERSNYSGTEEQKTDDTRTQTQEETERSAQLKRNGSGEEPIVLNEYYPKIKGVVIVADGAGDNQVKTDIYQAAKAVLNVSASRIEVFEGK